MPEKREDVEATLQQDTAPDTSQQKRKWRSIDWIAGGTFIAEVLWGSWWLVTQVFHWCSWNPHVSTEHFAQFYCGVGLGILSVGYLVLILWPIIFNIFKQGKDPKQDNDPRWFHARILSSGIVGGSYAFLLPVVMSLPEGGINSGGAAALRQAILLATGGLIALIALGETRRKNDNDKLKNDQDKEKNDREHERWVKAERRERYAKAVEQLGDEKAPVRMGGVYTLVGLVDDWLEEKSLSDDERLKAGQAIINNLCAYIRSPFPLASYYDELSQASPTSEGIYKDKEEEFYADKAVLESEADVRFGIIKEMHDHIQASRENDWGPWSNFEYNFSGSVFFYPVELTKSYYKKPVNFSGSHYYKKVDFSGSTYEKDATFSTSNFRSIYKGEANFSSSTYEGEANFSSSTYEGWAGFSGSIYKGKATFGESTYEKNVIFSTPNSHSTYKGKADFSGSTYKGWAAFSWSAYKKQVSFGNSTYHGEAYFNGSIYKDSADLSGSTYKDSASLTGSIYQSSADLSESIYQSTADLSRSIYESWADFSDSTYQSWADFSDSTYQNWANFNGSTYQLDVDFSSSAYQGIANFGGSTYQSRAYFSDSTYQNWADFSGSTYRSKAIFSNSTYQNKADFSRSIFYGEIYSGSNRYSDSSSRFTGCAPQFYDETNRKNTLFGSPDNDFTVENGRGYPIYRSLEGLPLGCKFLTSEQKEYLEGKFQDIEKINNKLFEVKDSEEKAELSKKLQALTEELYEWREEATTVNVEGTAPEEKNN